MPISSHWQILAQTRYADSNASFYLYFVHQVNFPIHLYHFLSLYWSILMTSLPWQPALVTVLGKAAMYINARLPELTSITVSSPEDLEDFQDVIDELTGEVLYVEDKRSPDFNGDRETMEYQGLNPDVRGPFVFGSGGSL